MRWDVPVELTPAESKLVKRVRRASKFYVFLREIRGELFDETFQDELAAAYEPRGQRPVPPALLAMVTLLQAYKGLSDADAVEAAEMDRRWQLVLGTLGEDDTPFGQGSLVRFRERMVAHDLDRKLVDRTVELAKAGGAFGWQKLKAALDSSPLLGAGRVEDTWNLLGRAMRRVVDAVCVATGREFESVVDEAQLDLLDGPSLKAALDINWDESAERSQALTRLYDQAVALQRWVSDNVREQSGQPPVSTELELLEALIDQDIEPDPSGAGVRIRRGTAKDRVPSVGDPEMRHGRKSRCKKFAATSAMSRACQGPT